MVAKSIGVCGADVVHRSSATTKFNVRTSPSIRLLEVEFSGTRRVSPYLYDDALGLRAAAILSLMFATPVFAQAAIQEPGLFAFYYPNNDVLNGGRPTSAEGLDSKMPGLHRSNPYAVMDSRADGGSCAQRYRSFDPGSATFLGYDGRRHACE